MEYDRITVAIRQRTPFEAIDLGFALTKRHWRSIETSFLATALPIALILFLALSKYPLIAAVIFWWFKPFYGRLSLFVASRALFGIRISSELISETPRILCKFLLGSLSIRRLCPWRGYSLPVRLLEGLKGRVLRKRLTVITGSGKLTASALTMVCFIFELILVYSLFVFIQLLTTFGPINETMFFIFTEPGKLNSPLFYWLYVMGVAVVEPFYVTAGFSLYINRRITLEGWDIELFFKRLISRIEKTGLRKIVAVSLLLFTLCFAGGKTFAQGEQAEDIKHVIEQVLEHEEFGGWEERTVWRPKWQKSEPKHSLEYNDPGILSLLVTLLAKIAPWILGGIAFFLILYIFFFTKARKIIQQRKAASLRSITNQPVGTAADDQLNVAFPENWVGTAARAWHAGNQQHALSLLYRGALACLVKTRGLNIHDSATETECLRQVRHTLSTEKDYPLTCSFERISQTWLYIAYAQRSPTEQEFQELCSISRRITEVSHGS